MQADIAAADVFSAREIARAAGVRREVVDELIRAGLLETLDGRYVPFGAAASAVERLRAGEACASAAFQPMPSGYRPHSPALIVSVATHAAALSVLALVTTGTARELRAPQPEPQRARLVFVATPGPGGGGGGGGLKQPEPPARATLEGRAVLRSPVPPPRSTVGPRPVPRRMTPPPPVRPQPVERPLEPPPAAVAVPLPAVVAPVAAVAADASDRAGVLTEAPANTTSQGPGTGGGAGSGQGAGIGEGEGAGVGPGSGGGTGGGPYRAGSGISPPSIVREVKPDYTEEARRRGITGDVVLEIVVRADGSVGQVRLLEGLGAGLDQRAIDAVRQWRFSPARRQGTPVDVLVEVAVEFKLR